MYKRQATGFAKWGMTSSMISAEAITNQILNRPNEMMEIFSPGREVSTSAILSMMKDGAHTVMDFSQYIIPVSYTHLDVYKRQLQILIFEVVFS